MTWDINTTMSSINDDKESNEYLNNLFELSETNKIKVDDTISSGDINKLLQQKNINSNVDGRFVNNNISQYKDLVNSKSNEILRKNQKYDSQKEADTFLNMSIKDIFTNISEVFNNFPTEFNSELIKAKYTIGDNESSESDIDKYNTTTDIIKIHGLAIMNYLKNNNTILYIGFIFIFISVILYIFNIII